MKMMPQQYCLRWKHHHTNVQNMFAQLLEKERFCDVTLYCSPSFATQVPSKDTVDPQNIRGVSLRAHRVVLAACSELLGALLGAHDALGEPVLVIDGAEPRHLRALLHYMYTGEMSVHHSQLASLLKTAEELRIKGLTDIRWNNKDEPPDCQAGGIITTTTGDRSPERKSPAPKPEPKPEPRQEPKPEPKSEPANPTEQLCPELRAFMKREHESDGQHKFSVNGGPPPLIKLASKDKLSPIKRENSDTDTQSPKRQRVASGAENTDDDSQAHSIQMDRDQEWQHGNLDISAERVVGWGGDPAACGGVGVAGGTRPEGEGDGSWSRSASEDEWADAPTDIGSFLHTRLRVDGDNSNDDESRSSSPPPPRVAPADIKVDMLHAPALAKLCSSSRSAPVDARFADVVKLSDYLQHGRRPQFWEENYVRRVMEAVRLKELEMKQAAEILGVSYGTLYGRYRDVYGCINRPYRTARDFWQAKGPAEVLERLQRGDVSLEAAALALGVSTTNLAAYVADMAPDKEFEPIPIEIDPSLKMKPTRPFQAAPSQPKQRFKPQPQAVPEKPARKILLGNVEDEDALPAAVIATAATGKWPSLRVAQLDTLRDTLTASSAGTASSANTASSAGSASNTSTAGSAGSALSTSPSQLMRTRPDLTIVAAKRGDKRDEAD